MAERISANDNVTLRVSELLHIGVVAQDILDNDHKDAQYYEGIIDAIAILLSDYFSLTPKVKNRRLYLQIADYMIETKIEDMFGETE